MSEKITQFKQVEITAPAFDAYPQENIVSGALGSNRINQTQEVGTFQSENYKRDVSGWMLSPNEAQMPSLVLIGSLKYGKTSWTDSATTGYYLGAEGAYFGSAADATIFKFSIADGSLKITGGFMTGTLFNQYFGDGSGGDIIWETNISLSADIYADNLTINESVTVYTNGWRIFCRNILTNNGTLDCSAIDNAEAGTAGNNSSGVAGGNGATGGGAIGSYYVQAPSGQKGGDSTLYAGNPGGDGTDVDPSLGVNGASGGDGGYNSFTTPYRHSVGGTAGTATGELSMISDDWVVPNGQSTPIYSRESIVVQGVLSGRTLSFSAGAGGGGSGGGETYSVNYCGGAGGGGGGAGGIIYIAARTLINNGTVSANGSRGREGGGGATGGGFSSGGGGGGGGGAGGLIFLVYQTIVQNGSLSVNGGTGGGAGALGGAVAGTAGTNGYVNQYHIIP